MEGELVEGVNGVESARRWRETVGGGCERERRREGDGEGKVVGIESGCDNGKPVEAEAGGGAEVVGAVVLCKTATSVGSDVSDNSARSTVQQRWSSNGVSSLSNARESFPRRFSNCVLSSDVANLMYP